MNSKKICFIYCKNDDNQFLQSIAHLKSLDIPNGFQAEVIAVSDANSITSAYNKAMRQSDAKYKVYLHQDVWIVQRSFLCDIISLFQKHPRLGLIGVAGAKRIPPNGIWWESKYTFGKVIDSHTGTMALIDFKNEISGSYEKVEGVDGLIMMTQYDIPWREDLFNGWHFYDLSQSFEFIKAGYEVGVPKQKDPWCIHNSGIPNLNGFEENRKLFVEHYWKYLGN